MKPKKLRVPALFHHKAVDQDAVCIRDADGKRRTQRLDPFLRFVRFVRLLAYSRTTPATAMSLTTGPGPHAFGGWNSMASKKSTSRVAVTTNTVRFRSSVQSEIVEQVDGSCGTRPPCESVFV